jgi:hypothetical protein
VDRRLTDQIVLIVKLDIPGKWEVLDIDLAGTTASPFLSEPILCFLNLVFELVDSLEIAVFLLLGGIDYCYCQRTWVWPRLQHRFLNPRCTQ